MSKTGPEIDQRFSMRNGVESSDVSMRVGNVSDIDEESTGPMEVPEPKKNKSFWRYTFPAAFSSLGAIYGDLGTSPLYVLNSVKYPHKEPTERDIICAVSVIFWVFTLIVIVKYVAIVLFFGPNNGEGGQVAIYAKIARHLKIGPKGVTIPGAPEKTDLELLSRQETVLSFVSSTNKAWKQNPTVVKVVSFVVLTACFLGCSLIISDGLLTPTTSVLSAIAGIQIAKPDFDNVLAVSEVVLLVLFCIQQFGSHKISFTFAPIITLWLFGLIICGLYNIIKYYPAIFKAISPHYAIEILKAGGIDVFSGCMLAITGTEAMFADVGHFGRAPVQLALTCFVYPALMLCYFGQAAYIIHHPKALSNPFFYSIPGGTNSAPYWIMFVLATLSTIIASQALILGVFSILSQLINLDCFPNFTIIHVSKSHAGKVYLPMVNWMLMVGVLCTTAGFKNSNNVTAAYGLGITLDLCLTTILLTLCFIFVYQVNIFVLAFFLLVFLPLEIVMVISNLKKIEHGAWFPIMMAGICFSFLCFWRWARARKVDHEFSSRARIDNVFPSLRRTAQTVDLGRGRSPTRKDEDESREESVAEWNENLIVNSKFGELALKTYDGVAIIHCESSYQNLMSPNTVPELYQRVVSSFASLPRIVIFCSKRALSVPVVPQDERVLLGPTKIQGHFRCVLRYGFTEEMVIDKDLMQHILKSVPGYVELNDSPHRDQIPVPVLHVFDKSVVKSHTYLSNPTRNILRKAGRRVRIFAIEHIFSPITSIFNFHGQYLKIEDEAEETQRKLFVGGVVRI